MRQLTLILVMASACAPDLRVDHPFDGQVSDGPLVKASTLGDGSTRLDIDATNKGSQVYVDLDEGKEMKADEAFSTNGWDLSFKRFEVSTNGGSGNPTGSVRALALKDQPYDALTKAPADGYQQDGAEKVFSAAQGGWYFYDLGAHKVVTRTDLVYVVQTSAGAYVKLQMLSYYDENGTPAAMSLKYAPIAAP